MKKIFILLCALLTVDVINAQGCLPEGISFQYQSQIDSFPINYPGCTEIEGDVNISDTWGYPSDIIDLNGLNSITSIGGSFIVWGCSSLLNLNGLENLSSVAGDLILNGNYAMTSFTGFESLSTVGGELWIGFCYGCGGSPEGYYGNPELTSITGLGSLISVGGDLQIGDNSTLQSLEGLENLDSIAGNLYIFSNDSLSDLSGLENLSSIAGELIIAGNYNLTSISGLENLTSMEGDLIINWNHSLTNLSGIENIVAASIENLEITGNTSLSTCEAQSMCDYLASPNGTVAVYGNAEGCNNPAEIASGCGITLNCLPYGNYYFFLQSDIDGFQFDYPGCFDLAGNVIINGSDVHDLSGLNGLTSIEGNIDIGNFNYGTTLTDLSGLDSLNFIGGDFTIRENSLLSNLTGLDDLDFIAGSLVIQSNSSLAELTGLENLDSIGGSLSLGGNYNDNLEGLNALKKIGGGFSINGAGDYEYHLTSLSGLDSLSSIGGSLDISYTKLLTDLSGLIGVTSIDGRLNLFANHSLISLTGLDNINAGSITGIYFQYNNSLSTCEIQSVCDYLAAPNGEIYINNNAPGCNSLWEVQTACQVGIADITSNHEIAIFPNPANKTVTITAKNGETIEELVIYSQTGQQVYRGIPENNTLDISKLQKGMYIIELVINHETIREKLIIE